LRTADCGVCANISRVWPVSCSLWFRWSLHHVHPTVKAFTRVAATAPYALLLPPGCRRRRRLSSDQRDVQRLPPVRRRSCEARGGTAYEAAQCPSRWTTPTLASVPRTAVQATVRRAARGLRRAACCPRRRSSSTTPCLTGSAGFETLRCHRAACCHSAADDSARRRRIATPASPPAPPRWFRRRRCAVGERAKRSVRPVDDFDVSGVAPAASKDEIKAAYKKLASQYHPDRNTAPDAEERFQRLSEACGVRSAKEKRQQYDAVRSYSSPGAAGAGPSMQQQQQPSGGGGYTGHPRARRSRRVRSKRKQRTACSDDALAEIRNAIRDVADRMVQGFAATKADIAALKEGVGALKKASAL